MINQVHPYKISQVFEIDSKIIYKIIVILFILFPKTFSKIKKIRTKIKRKV